MKGAVARLLHGAIDYAGLFPPAKLGLTEALDNYLRYIHGPEQWIVGRFVCPVSKLKELAAELAEHPEEPFVPVAVVGSQVKNRHDWDHAMSHDPQAIGKFIQDSDGHADVETYEIRVAGHDHLEQRLAELRGFKGYDIFIELPWGAEMDESLALLAETDMLGAKARTGGLEASAFPSSEALAGFLQQCAHLDLRFKLTAGLHHALPTQDKATGGKMHGFLNVMAALALLHRHDYTRREVQTVLEEADTRAFKLDESLTWRGQEAHSEDLDAVREVFVAFGSCSVDEPLQDLRELGLLGEAATR